MNKAYKVEWIVNTEDDYGYPKSIKMEQYFTNETKAKTFVETLKQLPKTGNYKIKEIEIF